MSDLYRWNPDTAIEEVWQTVQVEPLRQDLLRDGVLAEVEPVGTLTVTTDRGRVRSKHLVNTPGGIRTPDLPPGDYLLIPLEADDEQ